MSSTTSAPSGFFSSPRRQQRLLWISGAVLVIGVAVFLAVFLSRGNSSTAGANLSTVSAPPTSTTPVQKSTPVQKKLPASPAALKVARTFLETAVQRKNLDAAYGLVGPDLKGGMTRAQWRQGNIPVALYPSRDAKTAQFLVKSSHPNQLLLQVTLHARRGSGVRPALAFDLRLDRVGGKSGNPARWVVDYFMADYGIAVRANPYSN